MPLRLRRVDIVIQTVKNWEAAGYITIFGLIFTLKCPDIFLISFFSTSTGSPSEFLVEYHDVAALGVCARSSHLVATNGVIQSLLTICAGEELFSLRSVT